MSDSGGFHSQRRHVALLPNAGMGHLTPFLRLAASLVHHNCQVTLITTHPTVSVSEAQLLSRFLTAFPQVAHHQFHLLPLDPTTVNTTDPFWLRWEATRRSAHLLSPVLSSLSPSLSALIYDVSLISPVIPITEDLALPGYILFTSSARMFSLFAYLPYSSIVASKDSAHRISDVVEIPSLPPIPISSIPPPLLNATGFMRTMFLEDSHKMAKLHGVLINTFETLESSSLNALNGGKVVESLPPVYAIGPLVPREFERGAKLSWLDDQPVGSVVYVSFGSRTAMSREQIREIGKGLIISECKFLWVVKNKVVDREDADDLAEVLGHELMGRINDKGLVVKDWVDQGEVLGHKAVAGFVSHCGWNSVVEAAWCGVRVLAWPQHGDQRINAEVVEKSGLGKWVASWGWGGQALVKGEEIGKQIKEMMGSEQLRLQAAHIGEEERQAVGGDGSRENLLKGLIQKVDEHWKI